MVMGSVRQMQAGPAALPRPRACRCYRSNIPAPGTIPSRRRRRIGARLARRTGRCPWLRSAAHRRCRGKRARPAAALGIMARDLGGPALAGQLLTYPMLDHRTGSDACPYRNPVTGEFIWTRASNRFDGARCAAPTRPTTNGAAGHRASPTIFPACRLPISRPAASTSSSTKISTMRAVSLRRGCRSSCTAMPALSTPSTQSRLPPSASALPRGCRRRRRDDGPGGGMSGRVATCHCGLLQLPMQRRSGQDFDVPLPRLPTANWIAVQRRRLLPARSGGRRRRFGAELPAGLRRAATT